MISVTSQTDPQRSPGVDSPTETNKRKLILTEPRGDTREALRTLDQVVLPLKRERGSRRFSSPHGFTSQQGDASSGFLCWTLLWLHLEKQRKLLPEVKVRVEKLRLM